MVSRAFGSLPGLLIAGLGIGLIIWSRRPGAGNEDPDLVVEGVTEPVFQAIIPGNPDIVQVGPGGVLDLGARTVFQIAHTITVTNTGTVTRYVNAHSQFRRPITNFPDEIWLEHKPGLGLSVFPPVEILNPDAIPNGPANQVPPGETRQLGFFLFMDGPGVGPDETLFWLDYHQNNFRYSVEFLGVNSPSEQSGNKLFLKEYAPVEILTATVA